MIPPAPRRDLLPTILLAVAVTVVIFRLWTSFCFFPLPDWNTLRLTPTFMIRFGAEAYPGLHDGALTTWIYGPVPLLLNLPATLAAGVVPAVLIAASINLLVAILPVVLAVWTLSLGTGFMARSEKVGAVLLVLALWPNSSLHHIQADNVALAFGLVSQVFLVRARAGGRFSWFLAAFSAALAVWSKQTSVGLIVAQIAWLAWSMSGSAALRYAFFCAGAGLGLGAGFVGWFGFDVLWLNLVEIPGRIPSASDYGERTQQLWMQIAGYVVLPAIAVIVFRRTVWRRDSVWLLPALTWLCLLPLGVVSIYKWGGASNSLNGVLYLLPIAALQAVRGLAALRWTVARAGVAAAVLIIVAQQLRFAPLLPVRPMTVHLEEAALLAEKMPGQVWFPWHPLVTFLREGRFDHTEDGLHTRKLAGVGLSAREAGGHLPPQWTTTAVLGWREEGEFRTLQPASAQVAHFGRWTLFTWVAAEK